MSARAVAACRRLADHAGVRFVTLEPTPGAEETYHPIDPSVRDLLSPGLCSELGIIPIAVHGGAVVIASAEPVQYLPYDVAAELGGRPVSFAVAPADQVARAIQNDQGRPNPAGPARIQL